MKKVSAFSKISYVLLVIGGLNWGILGLFDYNVIGKIFSTDVARIIYSAVGLAALYGVLNIARQRGHANTSK